jgi:tRNA threonylcarbamoyladenosine biosynthesis protein TsaE
VRLESSGQTVDVGRYLGALLRAGDVVLLDGPLGSGKTTLARGIGEGMGVRGPVTSPTFVIARVHQADAAVGATTPLVHVDAYRVGSVDDLESLDLDESMEDSATVVEWGTGRVEGLASSYLTIALRRDVHAVGAGELTSGEIDSDDVRTLNWWVVGSGWDERVPLLTSRLGPQGREGRKIGR